MCNGWLFTANRQNKIERKQVGCPTCDSGEETIKHFHRCDKTVIQDTWNKCARNLQRIGTPKLILTCLKHIARGQTFEIDEPHDEYEATVVRASQDQCHIGWMQLIAGYLSNKWEQAYRLYHQQHGVAQKINGTSWVSKTIQELWIYSRTLWISRCNKMHDPEDGMSRKRKELESNVWDRYKYDQKLVPMYDRFLFAYPVNQRLKCSDESLKLWLENVKLAIVKAQDWYLREARKQKRTTSYFTRTASALL